MWKKRETFGAAASITLQRHALAVVADPQNAALLRTRRLRGTPGQDDVDLPPIHVQVSALPHVHVLASDWLKVHLLNVSVYQHHR